ncbi:acyltransferase family protein [Bradyrhizobium sp. CCBAU 11434]|uniref:acyltransferase family protein n=1 Tax=Bradyrhizobium sp. CCBAU 11434 TaxID=1630885 RepID=UPI002306D12E|nr:acyltransferase family protein [Bradyrhizobium sp. CCBAU 11434]
MRYRSEIDGLRTLAVVPVIAFHFGAARISGGYVGVDVFFVISGYLIGTMILAELRAGEFTFSNFYRRRFKRILPALFAMVFAVSIACCFVLLPTMLYHYGHSLISVLASASNIYFWLTSNYFAPVSESKPLLHTWSLAVEEQFYLVLPLLLTVLYRMTARRIETWIWILAAGSFAANVLLVKDHATFAFYMLPTRFWELGLGVLIGTRNWPWSTKRVLSEVCAGAGAILIVGSVFLFDRTTVFPGFAAVIPCLGTALIISSGDQIKTKICDVLSLPPVVFVGKLSYSLYLWHWPLLVLARQVRLTEELAWYDVGALIFLTFLLAALSYLFVEQPLRATKWSFAHVLSATVAATAVLGLIGGAFTLTRGMPGRFNSEISNIASFLDYNPRAQFREGKCFISMSTLSLPLEKECFSPARDGRKNVLLIGDSFAAHLWYGLAESLPEDKVLQVTASNCRPTIQASPIASTVCRQMIEQIFGEIVPNTRIERVILSARWSDADLPDLAATLKWTSERGIRTTVVGPPPEYQIPLPQLLAMSRLHSNPGLIDSRQRQDRFVLDGLMRTLVREAGGEYFSPIDILCSKQHECQTSTTEEDPVQYDYGHFTERGSKLIGQSLADALRDHSQ